MSGGLGDGHGGGQAKALQLGEDDGADEADCGGQVGKEGINDVCWHHLQCGRQGRCVKEV